MNLDEAGRVIAERIGGRATEDVAIEISARPDVVSVHVWSRNPLDCYHAWVELLGDGTVQLPAADDSLPRSGTPARTVRRAATVAEAVQLVELGTDAVIAHVAEEVSRATERARPAHQPAVPVDELREACTLWQGGRDAGSSLVRGAARALTGVHHYFRASFITGYERQARSRPDVLRAGIALLRAVNAAPLLDADGWNVRVGLPARAFAGRGISSKPDEDPQIETQLSQGSIEMPLWGVSLSPDVAAGFGTRFLFELDGPFPAVPAWVASGIKDDEQELVTGGRYRVVSQEQRAKTTHVRLRWIGASGNRVGSDAVLLGVLSDLPGVGDSTLTRSAGSAGEEELTVRLEGSGDRATVTRPPGAAEVQVERYWESDPGWDAEGDDAYAQGAAIRDASRRTTVPADVKSIVAAVLRGRENG